MKFKVSAEGKTRVAKVKIALAAWFSPAPIPKMIQSAMKTRDPLGTPDGDLIFSFVVRYPAWRTLADFGQVAPHRQKELFAKYGVDCFELMLAAMLAECAVNTEQAHKDAAAVKSITPAELHVALSEHTPDVKFTLLIPIKNLVVRA